MKRKFSHFKLNHALIQPYQPLHVCYIIILIINNCILCISCLLQHSKLFSHNGNKLCWHLTQHSFFSFDFSHIVVVFPVGRSGTVCLDVINQTWTPLYGRSQPQLLLSVSITEYNDQKNVTSSVLPTPTPVFLYYFLSRPPSPCDPHPHELKYY